MARTRASTSATCRKRPPDESACCCAAPASTCRRSCFSNSSPPGRIMRRWSAASRAAAPTTRSRRTASARPVFSENLGSRLGGNLKCSTERLALIYAGMATVSVRAPNRGAIRPRDGRRYCPQTAQSVTGDCRAGDLAYRPVSRNPAIGFVGDNPQPFEIP